MSDEVQHVTVPAPQAGQASPLRVPIFVGAIILGLGAIVLARHYERPDPPTETKAPGITVGSDALTLTNDAPMWGVVKLAPAQPSEPHWTDPVPARIVFDEARTSRMGSPLAGRVTGVLVERGQHVKMGERLFTVSSPGLAELHAELEKSAVEAGTAKVNYDRTRALVDAGSLPAKELVTAQQAVAEAELAVRLANSKLSSLEVAGTGEASFTVTAPRDGVVVEKTLNVGQNVDASSGSVMAIADLSDVWVVADLFENGVGQLVQGTKAKVIIGGTTEVDGQVDQVSAVVDPDRHTVPVRVRLANLEGTLRPNAYAQIKFYDPNTAKVALPASAVLSDGLTSYVYVKENDGSLKRRVVTAGSSSAGKMPILAGIEPGDQVVVQGAILLDNQIQLDN